MASISAFGFSGLDHAGTLFENYLSRKNAEWNSALQWKYAVKEATEGPSYRRRGLEAAGYNPLLAISGAANPLSGVVHTGYNPSVSFGEQGATDPSALAAFVDAVKQKKLETKNKELNNKIADKTAEQVQAEIEKTKAETKDIDASRGIKQIGMAAAGLAAGATAAYKGKQLYDSLKKPVDPFPVYRRGGSKAASVFPKAAKSIMSVAPYLGPLTIPALGLGASALFMDRQNRENFKSGDWKGSKVDKWFSHGNYSR